MGATVFEMAGGSAGSPLEGTPLVGTKRLGKEGLSIINTCFLELNDKMR